MPRKINYSFMKHCLFPLAGLCAFAHLSAAAPPVPSPMGYARSRAEMIVSRSYRPDLGAVTSCSGGRDPSTGYHVGECEATAAQEAPNQGFVYCFYSCRFNFRKACTGSCQEFELVSGDCHEIPSPQDGRLRCGR